MTQRTHRWNPSFRPEYRLTATVVLAVLALALCVLMGALVYVLWQAYGPTQNATPVGTPAGTSAPIVSSGDPVWDRIREANRIVVGVSADYPPFAYVAEDFSLQGYDIALAKEIGKRLDLPVELASMAFDGLLNAVQLGQIDMAVSAITITPERQAAVDFSSAYYAGEDAVLVNTAAPLPVSRVEDLAPYRVGVQQGSVYESWLKTTLVIPGLMPPQNLVTFPNASEAVTTLAGAAPPINAVVMDLSPAQTAISGKPLVLAARGLYPQSYGIAVPKGANTFRALLDILIGQMQRDGTLARLAQEHLDVQPAPLPTATNPPAGQPTAPPVSPAACLDGMQFVADINYPDNDMRNPAQVSPGEVIQKAWRIRNTGTCTWDGNYSLTYTRANPPNSPVGGSPVAIQGTVAPGQVYDVSAAFTAPPQPGRYQSFWVLRNGTGLNFGSRLWAGIEVVSAVTPTTGPNVPVIHTFTSTPQQIQAGQCVNLQWSYSGQMLALTRLFRGETVILTDMPTAGEYVDCPAETGALQYRLVIDALGGGSTFAALVVNVSPVGLPTAAPGATPGPGAVIQSFTVDRPEIPQGGCVNLAWAYTGSGPGTIFRNETPVHTATAANGTVQDCPPQQGPVVYRLRVGLAASVVYVTVLQTFP